jgi:hypothetical protein
LTSRARTPFFRPRLPKSGALAFLEPHLRARNSSLSHPNPRPSPGLPKEWRFWIADIRYDSFSSVETACGRRLREKAGRGERSVGKQGGSRGRQLSPRRRLSDWGRGAAPVFTYIAASVTPARCPHVPTPPIASCAQAPGLRPFLLVWGRGRGTALAQDYAARGRPLDSGEVGGGGKGWFFLVRLRSVGGRDLGGQETGGGFECACALCPLASSSLLTLFAVLSAPRRGFFVGLVWHSSERI